jgi:hypothetical protein
MPKSLHEFTACSGLGTFAGGPVGGLATFKFKAGPKAKLKKHSRGRRSRARQVVERLESKDEEEGKPEGFTPEVEWWYDPVEIGKGCLVAELDPADDASDVEEDLGPAGPAVPQVEASRIYHDALRDHGEWWDDYNQGKEDGVFFTDGIFRKFCQEYSLKPGSELARRVREKVAAGLT